PVVRHVESAHGVAELDRVVTEAFPDVVALPDGEEEDLDRCESGCSDGGVGLRHAGFGRRAGVGDLGAKRDMRRREEQQAAEQGARVHGWPHRGSGSGRSATTYAMTASVATHSRNSRASSLSIVSA